jgi:hypothetical protein
MSKRLNKKQLREKQAKEDKAFRKYLRYIVIVLALSFLLVNVFYFHWCDTRYFFRKYILYGKEISPELICEVDNLLMYHESSKIIIDTKIFYICSEKCKHRILEHNQQYANTIDAYSGDSICKADAIIGLKERGQPSIVYFQNKQTFQMYYDQRNK